MNTPSHAHECHTIILGYGYVGSFYLQKNPNIYYTSRSINHDISFKNNGLYFNLNDETSWKNNPDVPNVLWTFPAATNEDEIEKANQFYKSHLKNKHVIVLSSTSAYKQNYENESITENSFLKLNEPRFLAEENLRQNGATILHLSGIIGPNRTPLRWYQKNLVRYGENILNYIHIDDIVFFIECLFKNFKPNERLNLTSGDYKTHNMILKLLKDKNLIEEHTDFSHPNECQNSKKIQNTKILEFLKSRDYDFKKYPEHVEKKSNAQ
jgi:hypothetical protein